MSGVSAGSFIPGVSGIKDNLSGTFSSIWSQAASSAGYSAYISDVGLGGSIWLSDGVKWRPCGGRVTLKNLTAEVTNSGAAKIVLDYATCPTALIYDGDIIEIDYSLEHSGADSNATDILIGTVSTTLGTSTTLINAQPSGANTGIYVKARYKKVSATSIRPISLIGSVGYGVATALPTTVTGLPNMDTQTTYIQISSDLTAAAGDVVTLRAYTVTLISGS